MQEGDGFGSLLWERVVRHSIRPTMEDGFLLPYQDLLRIAAEEGSDPAEYVVHVPDEYSLQFSYATEHVSHDAALAMLLRLEQAVDKVKGRVEGPWDAVRTWLSERVAEVWQARGAFPGLGAALTAFGITDGVLLAHALARHLGDHDDPWPTVDAWIADADNPADIDVGSVLRRTWAALPGDRRAVLHLLARLDLGIDQAKRLYQETERERAGVHLTDAELLANPYLAYERDRGSLEPVPVAAVDRGVFPDPVVRQAHPLPTPSRVEQPLDERRVRALLIEQLEAAAVQGDSLRSRGALVQALRDAPLDPPCDVSLDVMSVLQSELTPEIEVVAMASGEPAYQLVRLHEARRVISRTVERRRKGRSLGISADWRRCIDELIAAEVPDSLEERARQEKAAALEVLASSRITVLIGAAGTGKTTLLKALAGLPEVGGGGLLLLAPTGKARVRMQAAIGHEAQTLAQLLVKSGWYVPEVGRYTRSDRDRINGPKTVIVDECSMLTEEALDALLDAVEGYDRLILVGDPRQLPPIGVGRPFIDIAQHLRAHAGDLVFPKVGPSYVELTIPRRQVEGEREDLLLAEWFSGADPSPGADEVWDKLGRGESLPTVSARRWDTTAGLHELLGQELAKALQMDGHDDAQAFEQSYGGVLSGDHMYFRTGSAKRAEDWQVLSPVRGVAGGVTELNRTLQRTYRARTVDFAQQRDKRVVGIPKPAGPQGVIYGDKVINIRNKRRKDFYPAADGVIEYVANGEIGVVVGPFKGKGSSKVPLNRLEVEFTTQQGVAYKFWPSELGGDDGDSLLELAYAITWHKSQGSEFRKTFVVLPNPCRLLSRELLYTALTRQQDEVVLLHQGDLIDLKQYASPARSKSSARLTNLFAAPSPVDVGGVFLEERLIHRTRSGIAVRSKSELVIADLLYSKQVPFSYEQPFIGSDGTWRSPDFTIDDTEGGTRFYWEHLGMLDRPDYRRRWERKLGWYRTQGVLPREEGGGPQGTLVYTRDGSDGSLSSADIEELVDELLGLP